MYDLGIIGAGPAGYVAAERAAAKGLSVVLFDKRELGGVCLNEGCIPTKTLLYTAKLYENALNGKKYGIVAENVSFDFGKIMARKNKIVRKLVGGIGAKMKKFGVEVVKGAASMEKRNTDGTIDIHCSEKTFTCKNVLVCTGSEAFIPPVPGLDKAEILTNREILELKELPKTLTIIGGGVIGVEFANFFCALGTKVTVIEMLPEILPGIDKDLSEMLRKDLEKRDITFNLSAKVTKVEGQTVTFEKDGKEHQVQHEKLLVSVGRRAVTHGFGLDKMGVEVLKTGIKIDSTCRTNIPNIYAAGDVTGFSLLAHTASREGEVVVNNLTGRKDRMRYSAIPAVVYTNPEVSCVGLTEEAAKAKGIEYNIRNLPMAYAGRWLAENEGGSGFMKILTGKKHNEILGVHAIGNPSSEFIYGAAMAIELELRLQDMEEVVFPHPTVSEIFKETVFAFQE